MRFERAGEPIMTRPANRFDGRVKHYGETLQKAFQGLLTLAGVGVEKITERGSVEGLADYVRILDKPQGIGITCSPATWARSPPQIVSVGRTITGGSMGLLIDLRIALAAGHRLVIGSEVLPIDRVTACSQMSTASIQPYDCDQ